MELSNNSKSLYLNKITYVNLRWIGVIGQFITINAVAFLFKFEFNFLLANIIVFLGALSNIFLFYFFIPIILFYLCTATISSLGNQKREKTSDCSLK